jgi:hypothetical protein
MNRMRRTFNEYQTDLRRASSHAELHTDRRSQGEEGAMQHEENTRLKIVRLIEPALCISCRFSRVATVEMQDDTVRKMMHCMRLDCDNWQMEDFEDRPRSICD